MDPDRTSLLAALKRRLIAIAVAGLVAAGLAVLALAATGPMTFHLALAVTLGTFFTVALGGGLFALSFFSARSGYDSDAAQRTTWKTLNGNAVDHSCGQMAKARAGKPEPFSALGQVATMRPPAGGTWSRLVSISICQQSRPRT